MTSSRIILIFLAFIFLIIVVLSSNRISSALRSRFGSIIPPMTPVSDELTPTPTSSIPTNTPTPTPTPVYGKSTNRINNTPKTIPAAGPADLAWLLLGGSFTAGVILKKITSKKT